MPKRALKYRVRIHYSEEDEGYIAVAPELPGCSVFGETPEAALEELHVAAALWLQAAKEMGRRIPLPVDEKRYSGKVTLRLPPALHRELEFEAIERGLSVDEVILHKLVAERFAEARRPPSVRHKS